MSLADASGSDQSEVPGRRGHTSEELGAMWQTNLSTGSGSRPEKAVVLLKPYQSVVPSSVRHTVVTA